MIGELPSPAGLVLAKLEWPLSKTDIRAVLQSRLASAFNRDGLHLSLRATSSDRSLAEACARDHLRSLQRFGMCDPSLTCRVEFSEFYDRMQMHVVVEDGA